MALVRSLVAGLILTIVLLSLASAFTVDLVATHSSCSPASTSTESSAQGFDVGNSSTYTNSTFHGPLSPLPVVSDALVLAPLAELSLTAPPQGGNDSAIADLSDPAYWLQIEASALRTEAQLVPQTVLGFFNSSQEWREWALQYIPEPPGWLTTGAVVYSQGLVLALEPGGGGTGNSTAVAQGIQDFAQSAAGLDLAALDYLTFNGLSAVKVLFETNDVKLAACETLPGQLAQLYDSAFNPALPRGERAQYLGQALAITSIMVIVGGKEGFAGKFQGGLDGVGMGDSWPAVKPYLGDIASKVSAGAASATFGVLQTLAQRFPSDANWATGLTANQVDTMVGVLQNNGVPDSVIQTDIQRVAQAAGSSPAEDGAAEAADDIEYQQGGWLQMVVNGQGKLMVFTDASGRIQFITVTWLKDNVAGFDPTMPQFVAITYVDQGETVYNYYSGPGGGSDVVDGGRQWNPSAPADVVPPNSAVRVRLQLLTPTMFVEKMPPLEFNGFLLNTRWVTEASSFTGYSLSGNDLTIGVRQSVVGGMPVSDFEIKGTQASLNWNGKVTFLQFAVVDVFGQPTLMRLVYDGYGYAQLRISTGQTDFAEVLLVSNDGVRLKFVYDTGPSKTSTTTVYVQPPSVIWSVSAKVPGDPQYLASGGSAVYQVDSVSPTRALEAAMMKGGSTYDKGVLGAEIAYTIGTQQLGLQDLILHEPSEGGADLNTADKTAFVQARLLDLSQTTVGDVPAAIQDQLPQMIDAIQRDFSYNKATATVGYAIISYIDSQYSIHTIIVQVPYP